MIQVDVTMRGDVPDVAREHAQEKVGALDRLVNIPVLDAEVVLVQEANPRIERSARAECELDLNGRMIRAKVTNLDPIAAVDSLTQRLKRQLRSFVRTVAPTGPAVRASVRRASRAAFQHRHRPSRLLPASSGGAGDSPPQDLRHRPANPRRGRRGDGVPRSRLLPVQTRARAAPTPSPTTATTAGSASSARAGSAGRVRALGSSTRRAGWTANQ